MSHPSLLGSGAVHLHVRVDGEVRRSLWRATGIHVGVDVLVIQLPPEIREKVILFGLLCGALFTAVVGTMGAKFVIGLMAPTGVSRSRNAELDRLPLYSAWLLSDVLPLPAGRMCVLATGELPHHDQTMSKASSGDATAGSPEGAR